MPFEDELGKALHNTGGTFHVDQRALVAGGLARGRKKLARRRAALVTGSALTVALVAAGGLYAVRTPERPVADRATEVAKTDAYRHFEVTAEQMEHILENGMERSGIARTSPRVEGSGSTGPATPAKASMTFGDGWGEAIVTVSVRRVDPADPGLRKLLVCPPEKGSPYEECTNQPGDRAVKGYTEAGKAGGVKKWAVTMVSPNGYLIELATQNVQVSGSVSPKGRNPRMSPGKLRHLGMFVDASLTPAGEPNAFGTVEPGAAAEPGDILPILKSLLPERLTVYSEGGTGADGHVVVSDGKGGMTYIEAVRVAGDKDFWSETLPDGTKVGTQRVPAQRPGVVRWRADALRVNGLRMAVSAYNAPTPTSAKRGAEPLITMGELKAIALSRTWLAAR
ncbi:hypothetical protein [Streptomyces lavendofoliae]|uniref:Uncharacterized protein n=1 Tax=Streptomyces lavendofoliae TaxID=67314 RepID=A0A918M2S1_9ACTN|nr:hypothetical protein [Streptomyces lavendofoliae]GGU30014.1 hypothetical protein GCM10010274_16290 [Streptomyces lavendofoliae]